MQTEKLLLPRWIIPLEGDTEVLENYGLAIENGRIAALIPPADLKNVEAQEVFELPDNVVMPGCELPYPCFHESSPLRGL